MKAAAARASSSWPSLVILAGGLLMVLLWPIYTMLHGPTSFYQRRLLLGMEGQVWGFLMEGPPSLLIVSGLIGHRPLLTGQAGRMARVGFVLTLVGLMVPALIDFATVAIGPPLLAPLLVVGLLMLALGNRGNPGLPQSSKLALWGMAVVLLLSFSWAIMIPLEVSDRIGGYRIFGLMANLLFGAGWVVFGTGLWRRAATTPRMEAR